MWLGNVSKLRKSIWGSYCSRKPINIGSRWYIDSNWILGLAKGWKSDTGEFSNWSCLSRSFIGWNFSTIDKLNSRIFGIFCPSESTLSLNSSAFRALKITKYDIKIGTIPWNSTFTFCVGKNVGEQLIWKPLQGNHYAKICIFWSK